MCPGLVPLGVTVWSYHGQLSRTYEYKTQGQNGVPSSRDGLNFWPGGPDLEVWNGCPRCPRSPAGFSSGYILLFELLFWGVFDCFARFESFLAYFWGFWAISYSWVLFLRLFSRFDSWFWAISYSQHVFLRLFLTLDSCFKAIFSVDMWFKPISYCFHLFWA